MGRGFVVGTGRLRKGSLHLMPQFTQVPLQLLDLKLLADHRAIQFFDEVFGKADLDFDLLEA